VFLALEHFYWLPNYINNEMKNHVAKEKLFVEMLGTAITPGLLTNDIAQVYKTLEKVLSDRKYLHAIALHNAKKLRIFPLAPPVRSDLKAYKKLDHEIDQQNRRIGQLEVWIDIQAILKGDVERIQSLETIFFILVLFVSVAATFWQSIWIRKPLEQLRDLSTSLSQGRYDTILTYQSSDEIGTLVRSFITMREDIKERENQIQKANAKLSKLNEKLEKISNTDALTNTANRRMFDEVLAKEVRRNSRQETSLALILCDIDFFKQYNDTYGHQKGDGCLRKVAVAIKKASSRSADLVARYGGEEFAVILPNTREEQAVQMAQKIQLKVQALKIPHKGSSISNYVTISLGVVAMVPDRNMTMSALIEYADKALYEAKSEGRNRVSAA